MKKFGSTIRQLSKKNFRYYNQNPYGNTEQDCVCRAISFALGISYRFADKLLRITSKLHRCEKLCLCCYHHLLEEFFKIKCTYFRGKIKDLCEMFPHNILIIRIDGHLTCSVFGVVHDIWDCTDKDVTCYWIV